jgi:hypothetical protein
MRGRGYTAHAKRVTVAILMSPTTTKTDAKVVIFFSLSAILHNFSFI